VSKRAEIRTPRGWIQVNPDGKAELTWNPDFKEKWNRRYTEAQIFVDSEVLRSCEPYVPFDTGMLMHSGTLGTEIGSGTVQWIAPYARYQYYMKNRKKVNERKPLAGSFWFERMKEVHGRRIISEARKIAGGGK
jgi:hypothetical protein